MVGCLCDELGMYVLEDSVMLWCYFEIVFDG